MNEVINVLCSSCKYCTGIWVDNQGFPSLCMCQLTKEMPHINSMEVCKHYQYEEGKKI